MAFFVAGQVPPIAVFVVPIRNPKFYPPWRVRKALCPGHLLRA